MTTSGHSPHDKFFKLSMHNKTIASDFFRHFLPKHVVCQVDWDTLTLEPETLIDREYASAFTDILYSVQVNNKAAFFYLLAEHQSTPDKVMPLRLLSYLCRIWERHRKQTDSQAGDLPIIYPLVLYHGKQRPYPYSMDFFDLFSDKTLAKEVLLSSPFSLIDVSAYSDQSLCGKGNASLMLMLQKHVYRRDLLRVVKQMQQAKLLDSARVIDSGGYIGTVLTYVLEKSDPALRASFVDQLTAILPEDREKIMSVADLLREEGRKQGMRQGMQQGMQEGVQQGKALGIKATKQQLASKMMRLGMDSALIAELTDLTELSLARLLASEDVADVDV